MNSALLVLRQQSSLSSNRRHNSSNASSARPGPLPDFRGKKRFTAHIRRHQIDRMARRQCPARHSLFKQQPSLANRTQIAKSAARSAIRGSSSPPPSPSPPFSPGRASPLAWVPGQGTQMRIGQDMEHNGEHNPRNTRTRGFVHGGECLFQIEEKEVKRRAVIREYATIAEYQCPSRMNTNRAGLRAAVPGQHDANGSPSVLGMHSVCSRMTASALESILAK